MKRFIQKIEGYTLLEVLTAFTLFVLLIVPFYQFILFFTSNSHAIDSLNAVNLAETEMDKALIHRKFIDTDYSTEINGKKYRIHRESKTEGNLVFLRVSVHSLRKNREIVHFMTCFIERGNNP